MEREFCGDGYNELYGERAKCQRVRILTLMTLVEGRKMEVGGFAGF